VFLRAATVVPELDGVLHVGGLDVDDDVPVAEVTLLDFAQGCERFVAQTTTGTFEPTAGGSLVWDPIGARAVHLFGLISNGVDFLPATDVVSLARGATSSDPWTFTTLTPTGTLPIARVAAAVHYDAAHHQAIVYGGITPDFISGGPPVFLGDAYAFSLADGAEGWRPLNLPDAPDPTVQAAFGIWPAGNAFAIVGGCTQASGCDDAGDWSNVDLLDLTPGSEAWTTTTITPQLPGLVIDGAFRASSETFILLTREGDDGNRDFHIVEVTPVAGGAWTAETLFSTTTLPPPRARHLAGIERFGDRRMFVSHGGNWDVNFGFDGELLGDTWSVDLDTDEWVQTTSTGNVPPPRLGMAFGADSPQTNGQGSGLPLIMHGGVCDYGPGNIGDAQLCDDVYLATVVGDHLDWTRWPGASPPPARVGAAGFGTSGGTVPSVRVVGGRVADATLLADDHHFRPGGAPQFANGTWSTFATLLPPAQFDAAAGTRSDGFTTIAVMFGGRTADFTITDDLWVSDLYTEGGETWVQGSPAAPPPPRAGASLSFVSKGALLLFGGQNDFIARENDLWMFDTRDVNPDNWVFYDVTADVLGTAPTGRSFHTAQFDSEADTLYVFGGTSGPGPTSQLWSLGPLNYLPSFP
jgi:hypothetical protein